MVAYRRLRCIAPNPRRGRGSLVAHKSSEKSPSFWSVPETAGHTRAYHTPERIPTDPHHGPDVADSQSHVRGAHLLPTALGGDPTRWLPVRSPHINRGARS